MKKHFINLVAPLAELILAIFFCIVTFNGSSIKTTINSNNLNAEKVITDSSLIALERIVTTGNNIITSPMAEEPEKLIVEEKETIIKEVIKPIIVEEEKTVIKEKIEPIEPIIKGEETKKESVVESSYNVIETYVGTLTGYGNDCRGCGNLTAANYDISNTIYYDDPEFGRVRIVAAGTVKDDDLTKLPFYSIVRISNVINMEPIIAIVLDRGGSVGYGKVTLFDLLFESESLANNTIGKINNVTFELLRRGK